MGSDKVSSKLLVGILLTVCFGAALSFRICFPYDQVFTGEGIKFTGVDAYFQMRLVDNIVHNFPHLTAFDPYLMYPGLQQLGSTHFFNWLLSGIIWVIGLGSPSQHLVDVVGVYFPAILGALVVIPVYFIGRALFNRWVGLLAAALIAILPGEFMGRSILGFTDQHVAEALFSTVAVLFLILAIKSARQSGLTYNHLWQRNWAVSTRPLVYALLAGVFLGVYFITWTGALLFVFILALYFIIQFIVDHLRGQSTDYLGITGIPLFLISLLIFLPFSTGGFPLVSIYIALLMLLVLSGVSRLVATRGVRPVYYPLTLLGLAVVGVAVFYAVNPSLLQMMVSQFSIFAPTGATAAATLEMQPLLAPNGELSIAVAWGNYTTGFFFSLITLAVLIYLAVKRGPAEWNLLLVWSVVILAATLGQRRFAYYFAVNVAVLTGYFAWQFLQVVRLLTDWLTSQVSTAHFRQQMVESLKMLPVTGVKEPRTKKHRDEGSPLRYFFIPLAVIIVIVFVYVFNMTAAAAVASKARFAPSDAWQSSLVWMRENTPEPFGDPGAYYRLYKPPPPRKMNQPGEGASVDELREWVRYLRSNYDYPESAYGVVAWWDYGYWVSRIAHRLPTATPGQNAPALTLTAHFLLSQDEAPAREIIQDWSSSYVILDHMTTTTKFWAIVLWAGKDINEFVGQYYISHEGKLVPVNVFYPRYYQSLCTRLYNFDGKAVTPEIIPVISYEEEVSSKGKPFKQITGINTFTDYNEALEFINSQKNSNCSIVGNNQFVSPVPLEAVNDYELVHSSDDMAGQLAGGSIPAVKIFKFTGE